MKYPLIKTLPIGICGGLTALAIVAYPHVGFFNPTEEGMISYVAASYPANLADNKILMGAAHNVFIGKVVSQIGTESRSVMPETQFSVEIIDTIKGNLEGRVTVNQEGGYKDEVLYMMEGGYQNLENDPYLLEPGSTYLFATRYSSAHDWHTLIPFHTGRKLLSRDENLSVAEYKALADADESISTLREAYPNEILLYADVANGNARNSYQSIHPEAPPSKTTRDLEEDR